MRPVASILMLASVLSVGFASPAVAQGRRGPPMTLSSSGFDDGGVIPVRFSQAAPGVTNGGGTSPALTWTNAPEGTQSFLLHMHDMDVARSRSPIDQLHWLVWNIPASATGLPEGVQHGARLPDGSYQTSASGRYYRGPGAPAGGPRHHYVFEIYALDTTLDITPGDDPFADRDRILDAIQGHVLGKAVTMGLFRRLE